jgi:hypothetical protein
MQELTPLLSTPFTYEVHKLTLILCGYRGPEHQSQKCCPPLQACQGVVQEDLLKEFGLLEPLWTEGLQLTLNTGNAAYEHTRNTLHYLLLPDGTCRNLPEPAGTSMGRRSPRIPGPLPKVGRSNQRSGWNLASKNIQSGYL